MRISRPAGWLIALAVGGCSGSSNLTADRWADGSPMATPSAAVDVSGARRLTRTEFDNTVRDLLGDITSSGFGMLPPDAYDPFDNDYRTQLPSPTLIEALEVLATNAAARLAADPARRSAFLPGPPPGPADATCFRNFIVRFGRKALRRPLSTDEVQSLLGFQAFSVEGNDFFIGVQLVIRTLLQHPEFVYRVEVGAPVDGVDGLYRLNNFEVATRLSYFLWGTTPPDWLLDIAEAGRLQSAESIRSAPRRAPQE